MAIGRISGQLLKDDLQRDGKNLAFDTDLIYLDVVGRKVGINNISPQQALDVTGTIRSTNIVINTAADIANLHFATNTISSTDNTLNLVPNVSNAVVVQAKLQVDNLELTSNNINALGTDKDINLRPTGAGKVIVNSNMLINGNLTVTGTITADAGSSGIINLGDSNADNVVFNADINSNIIPNANETFSLGESGRQWLNTYTKNLYAATLTASTVILNNGINLSLYQGKTWYVAYNGNDTYSGQHQNDPYASVVKALSVAQSGDTVYIYPGTYTEIFPMTVPVGVTVRGAGIRSVLIQPTTGTRSNDAFLLNGETTVEDLTVGYFEYNSGANTGHAFRYATGFRVTTRSPYVRNVTVITQGSTVRLGTNPANDPRGFLAGDAGRGGYFDGSIADSASKDVSMLFHALTFITPGINCITATNGVRIEWLNSFIYFALRGFNLTTGATGQFGTARTAIKIPAAIRVGTWAVSNTLTYYDTNGSTVIGTGVIAAISGDWVYLTGKCTGFETITDRTTKTITVNGDAKLSTSVKKFGSASLILDGVGDFISIPTQPDFGFTSNISRLAKTITANGNAAVSATQSKFGGSSIAFDGTGDYLSISSDTDYGFGTGDFTIEGWFYKTAATTQYLFDTRTTLTENSVVVQSNGSGSLRLFVNGAFVLTSSNAHTNNAWNHLAISRASGVTRFFINGVVSTTTYTDTTNYGTTKPLVVGAQYNGTTAFAGYIDDFRVSNTARYTATFTPTTTAFVDDFNTKLLINGNSTIVDDASYGTATDFTIEGWIYPTAGSAYQTIFDFRSASIEKAIFLGINTSNQIYLYVNGVITITTAATVSLSTWTHVALVRRNASTKIYLNGTQSGSSWTDITDYGTTKPLRIGADYTGSYGFTGYIDDASVSKGLAKYTSNFTAPTSALVGDTDTVLLLHFNGTNNSTVIVDDGVTLQDLRTSAGGTANLISYADYTKFGSEIRAIGSANVYGTYGFVGDGPGVIAYLVSHNFAYVGADQYSDNDPTRQIPANEVVKTNGAKIFYSSIDNQGNFNVGDYFSVNQKTGEVIFNGSAFNIPAAADLVFTDGLAVTTINASKVETGNINISGNTITTLNSGLTLSSASGVITIDSTRSFVIPTGNVSQRPSPATAGAIRFNNETGYNWFEGYNGSNWIPLGQVTDLAQTTYIKAEATPGAGDKTLYFYANGTQVATLTDTAFTTDVVDVGNFEITNNTITAVNPSTDIDILPASASFTASIAPGAISYFKGSISGTTLTVSSAPDGAGIVIGQILTGPGIKNNTYVTANLTGTGTSSSSTWTINNTQNQLTANFTGNITGTTLSVISISAGAVATGQFITGPGVASGTYIVQNLTSNEVGSTWEVNISQEVPTDGLSSTESIIASQSIIMTVNTVSSGTIGVGYGLSGNGLQPETAVTALLGGSGLTGTYLVTPSQTITLRSMTGFNSTGIVVSNIKISTNTIANTTADAVTVLKTTGDGYVRISGTNGVVIPSGSSGTRPAFPTTGMIRYNTDAGSTEIYDGTLWTGLSGATGAINITQAQEAAIVSAILFG